MLYMWQILDREFTVSKENSIAFYKFAKAISNDIRKFIYIA